MASWRRRLRRLFPSRYHSELAEEMRLHRELLANEEGLDAAAVSRRFGNDLLLGERSRDVWGWNWLDGQWRNCKYCVRTLRRSPAFAVASIVVIALGIGVNAALFTVVRSVLLKPLPFAAPQRLVRVYEREVAHGLSFPYNDNAAGVFAEWEKQDHMFSGMAISGNAGYALSGTGGQRPEIVHAATVSSSMLPVLGVQPILGRNFSASDNSPSSEGTVLLSWSLWMRRFGGNPSVLNQTIPLSGRPYTVIGVMPSWFAYPDSGAQLWTPIHHEYTSTEMQALDQHNFQAVGRLKPGVSLPDAVAELSLITLRIHAAHPDDPFVSTGANGRFLLESIVGDVRASLFVLLAATACVLLIACLNIANLLLARSVSRRRELSIRTALGASRAELLWHHLTESLLLSVAGGLTGLVLAWGLVRWFVSLRRNIPRIDTIHVDGVVLAFVAGLVVLSAAFAGLVSAFSIRGDRLQSALQESSRSHSGGHARTRLRRAMMAVEVGLTVVLLIGAGLLLKSYARLRSADLGCLTRNVLTMDFSLPAARYDFPGAVHFYQALLTRARHYPGVRQAGLVSTLPGNGYGGDNGFTILGRPPLPQGRAQSALHRWADPGYFAAMGIPFHRGHTFDNNQQLAHGSEVIISDALERQYFPGDNPIGETILAWDAPYRIVGVVGNTLFSVAEPARPMIYFPMYALLSPDPKDFLASATLVVRSGEDVAQFSLPIQKTFQQLDRDLPVSDILTMDQVIGKQTLNASFDATLLLVFALVSLLLAAVGLFGVLSYLAAQRTHEIGVRIALGAERTQVLTLILGDGLRIAVIGLVLGLAICVAVTRWIQSLLYQTRPLDPEIFGLVALAVFVVATAACIIPAWRAARLDPAATLRME